ncbi:hypothetical protein M0812_20403 [Anaeramoeba flamelloides]|uniref:Uncharacterized protein n=1 Tax=Anaeramoeba flamelloides TaxID=1746091 RepID=A0AAV7YP45_9EUKA|nr:hypothetical protein M0812_20403 [Anaeramoeba flamelloides]
MSGKDYAKIINLSVNSVTMGKIMDFLNKIRRYKPRWEDTNRIIYTHFYLCPEHIKPLIEDENKLCDKMRKYLRGDLIGQFIDFQIFLMKKDESCHSPHIYWTGKKTSFWGFVQTFFELVSYGAYFM